MNRSSMAAWGAAAAIFAAWQFVDYQNANAPQFDKKAQERWNEQQKMLTKAKEAVGLSKGEEGGTGGAGPKK